MGHWNLFSGIKHRLSGGGKRAGGGHRGLR
jgi:hypothetical protein